MGPLFYALWKRLRRRSRLTRVSEYKVPKYNGNLPPPLPQRTACCAHTHPHPVTHPHSLLRAHIHTCSLLKEMVGYVTWWVAMEAARFIMSLVVNVVSNVVVGISLVSAPGRKEGPTANSHWFLCGRTCGTSMSISPKIDFSPCCVPTLAPSAAAGPVGGGATDEFPAIEDKAAPIAVEQLHFATTRQ